MGRFPRFCVNTYRWGDKFFNGYDTTYVDGTGYKWNVKLRTESWTDYYNLHFENDTEMSMISNPSTSVGLYLTYMAVSLGYDMNVSKYFNGHEEARRRWNFGFNCMLFSANLYFLQNDVGTHISTLRTADGDTFHPDIEYKGIDNTSWGFDLAYFFTHRRYSHAAAFNFSRIQKRSGGSFFAGFSFNRVKYHFDFNNEPRGALCDMEQQALVCRRDRQRTSGYAARPQALAPIFGHQYGSVARLPLQSVVMPNRQYMRAVKNKFAIFAVNIVDTSTTDTITR